MSGLFSRVIRVKDVDFTKAYQAPYAGEYSKNKLPREVYISNEATEALKKMVRIQFGGSEPDPDILVYAVRDDANPTGMLDLVSKESDKIIR